MLYRFFPKVCWFIIEHNLCNSKVLLELSHGEIMKHHVDISKKCHFDTHACVIKIFSLVVFVEITFPYQIIFLLNDAHSNSILWLKSHNRRWYEDNMLSNVILISPPQIQSLAHLLQAGSSLLWWHWQNFLTSLWDNKCLFWSLEFYY